MSRPYRVVIQTKKVKSESSMNRVKLIVAFVVLIAGIFVYYKLPDLVGGDVSTLAPVAALLVSILASLGIAATSESGRALIEFSKGSQIELRKMVWPTRQETIQTTMIVMVMVVLVALFLWLIDIAVFEVIYDLLLGVDD